MLAHDIPSIPLGLFWCKQGERPQIDTNCQTPLNSDFDFASAYFCLRCISERDILDIDNATNDLWFQAINVRSTVLNRLQRRPIIRGGRKLIFDSIFCLCVL